MIKAQSSYDKFQTAFQTLCEEKGARYRGDKETSRLLQAFTKDLTSHKLGHLQAADKIGTNQAVLEQLRKLESAITALHPSVCYFLSERINIVCAEELAEANQIIEAAQKIIPEAKTHPATTRIDRKLLNTAMLSINKPIPSPNGMFPSFKKAVERACCDANKMGKQTFKKTICDPEFWAVHNALFWIKNDYCTNTRLFRNRQLYITASARSGFAFKTIALLFEHTENKKTIRQIEPLIQRALDFSPTLKN